MGADLYIEDDGLSEDNRYFRDRYNSYNCLNTLGLSWWQHVSKDWVNEEGLMSVANVKKFLCAVQARMIGADDDAYIKTLITSEKKYNPNAESKWTPKARREMKAFWTEHRAELVLFLQRAIKLNKRILCSL